jgi:ketosteroid isomerase-like protein
MMRNWKFAIIIVSVAVLTLWVGCSGDAGIKKTEAENMATVRYVHAELAKGNYNVFDEVLAPNYIRHCQAMPPDLWEITDPNILKSFVTEFFESSSDYSETIDLMMAEGDKVAYILTMKGTQTGPMGGLPATGKEYNIVNIIIQRFENGKIAETWVSWDNVAMLTQLGFFPPPDAQK